MTSGFMKNLKNYYNKEGAVERYLQPCSLKSSATEDRFLSTHEAARYLGLPSQSLLNMTSNGKIKHHKLGRRNRYLLSDLKQLLLANQRGPEGD